MEDSTLEKYFEDLTEKIDDLKADLKENDDRQRSQYKKVIVLEEYQKIMKKNIQDHKTNVRWSIGVIVPTITAAITAAFLFISKP